MVIARVEAARHAQLCRVAVEATGHYHRTLVSRLCAAGAEVVQLNPAAVKQARSQQLMRTLKSDQRDLGAMAKLMVRGGGRPVPARSDALAAQLAWVGHARANWPPIKPWLTRSTASWIWSSPAWPAASPTC